MPEEIETARIRRLRDFATERLDYLLEYHTQKVKDITFVLENPDSKEPRLFHFLRTKRDRLEKPLKDHKAMVKAIQSVLEERKEEER